MKSSEQGTNYDVYASSPCSEIPLDYLKGFIAGFLYEASIDMGQAYEKDIMIDRVEYIISKHYHHLPLSLIASAFKRGSLGQYGAGRLTPRTVFGWLSEMNQYYMNVHEKKDEDDSRHHKFDGLEKYPLGKAICKKIDWLYSGAITSNQWDKIPLKDVAEMIGRGEMPTLSKFGIYVDELIT